jgi:uncharacterized protein (DUF736 family)
MSSIGTFAFANEQFSGTVRSLNLNIKARIVPVADKRSEDSPDYRVVTGNGYELGVAWARVSRSNRGYLSVSLDDPSLPAPIYARLIESSATPGEHELLWSRARRGD